VLCGNLIGPKVIEGCLTAPFYRNFPGNGLSLYTEITLLHKGAQAHFFRKVTEFLKEIYKQILFGRNALVDRPARPHERNALDFLLRGCVNSRVYHSGTAEGRRQYLMTIDEAAFGICNEPGFMQCRHSMAQRLAVCYAGVMLGIWSKCCNNLDYSMLL
jgi:hypothetical protein